MLPEIFVHPLPASAAESLATYWKASHRVWSQTQLQILRSPALLDAARLSQQLHHAITAAGPPLAAPAAERSAPAPAPSPAGRLIVELIPAAPGKLQVIITRTCDSADALASEAALLAQIQRLWPEATTSRAQPPARRGGPAGTPEDQRLQIVRGWLGVQGRMNQEVYAGTQGIAVSTLRRWMRQLQAARKL